jgi:hypothetical protein
MTILLTKYLIAVAIIALVMAIAAVGKRALSAVLALTPAEHSA